MLIYQLLIRLLSPVIVLAILVEAIKNRGGWRFFLQKTGLYFPPLAKHGHAPVWIHCASVGELKAAEPLIRALIAEHSILITTNTATSQPLVGSLFGDRVEHRYLPFDWSFALRRFIRRYQPVRLWIVETEIWPNLFRTVHKQHLELCILNGRLSHKTFNAPKWLQTAYRNSLRRVDKLIVRSEKDAQLFVKMGADRKRITVLGNLKYAAQPEVEPQQDVIGRDYLLAASTHEDEELKITQLWQHIDRDELLVIVPRHPKRSEHIQAQLAFLGDALKVASKGQQPNSETKVFLDDRIGHLLPLFAHAKLVIMGGSFAPKGGHNILEPAAFKRAILTGPDMRDFEDELAMLQTRNGILCCQDYAELESAIVELFNHPKKRADMGLRAYQALQSQKDTLQNYLKVLNIT